MQPRGKHDTAGAWNLDQTRSRYRLAFENLGILTNPSKFKNSKKFGYLFEKF